MPQSAEIRPKKETLRADAADLHKWIDNMILTAGRDNLTIEINVTVNVSPDDHDTGAESWNAMRSTDMPLCAEGQKIGPAQLYVKCWNGDSPCVR